MNHTPNDQLLESLSALVDDEAGELEVRRILKTADSNPELLEKWRRYNLIGSALRRESEYGLEQGENEFASSISALLDKETVDLASLQSDDADSGSAKAHVANASMSSAGSATATSKSFWELIGKTSIAASFAAAVVLSFNFVSEQKSGGSMQPDTIAAVPSMNVDAAPVEIVSDVPEGFRMPVLESRTVSQSNYPANYFHDVRRASEAAVANSSSLTDVETQEMLNQMLIYHAERASVNGGLGMMPYARVSKMQASSQ